MAPEILDTILPLPIDRLLKVFDDLAARCSSSCQMGIHVIDNHGQHLRNAARINRRGSSSPAGNHHDECGAYRQLRAAGSGRLTVTIVFPESKYAHEPIDCFGDIPVDDVREHSLNRDGAVPHTIIYTMAADENPRPRAIDGFLSVLGQRSCSTWAPAVTAVPGSANLRVYWEHGWIRGGCKLIRMYRGCALELLGVSDGLCIHGRSFKLVRWVYSRAAIRS